MRTGTVLPIQPIYIQGCEQIKDYMKLPHVRCVQELIERKLLFKRPNTKATIVKIEDCKRVCELLDQGHETVKRPEKKSK